MRPNIHPRIHVSSQCSGALLTSRLVCILCWFHTDPNIICYSMSIKPGAGSVVLISGHEEIVHTNPVQRTQSPQHLLFY